MDGIVSGATTANGRAWRGATGTVALLAAWGAFAGAFGEFLARLAVLTFRASLPADFYFYPKSVWVAPLVNLPLYLVAGTVAALAARAWRPSLLAGFVAFSAIALAVLEILLTSRNIHPAALAVLAAGIGTVAVRIMSRAPGTAMRAARVSLAMMVLLATVLGLAGLVTASRTEQRALATLPAAPAGSPNVLLLILDTVRADELGVYGNPRPVTPYLDSLARNAIRFENAFATAPWTLPSHATLLSGRYRHELSLGWSQPYDGAHPLVSQELRNAGYATGAFVGNLLFLTRRWGLDRGFIHYEDYQLDVSVLATTSALTRAAVGWWNRFTSLPVPLNRNNADVVRQRFARWERSVPERPFFALVNLFDVHAPYGAPAPFDTLFLGRRPRYHDIRSWRRRPPGEQQELRAGYDQALAWLDSQVRELMSDLRASGRLENTFVVITADHGEEFGEHGFSGHGSGLNSPTLHVPLVVIPPRWRGERIVRDFVTLRDMAATLAEAGTLTPSPLPGTSLSRFWRDGADRLATSSPIRAEARGLPNLMPWYPSANGPLRSIIEAGLHYIAQDGGREWLYDLGSDPLEQHNLVTDSSHAAALRRLRTALSASDRGGS